MMTKIRGTAENWESGKLGTSFEHAVQASPEESAAIEQATGLGMQPISIRLQRNLINALKEIAKYHGIGYQPMIRDLLQRFAVSEVKGILQERQAELDRQAAQLGDASGPVGDFMRKAAEAA